MIGLHLNHALSKPSSRKTIKALFVLTTLCWSALLTCCVQVEPGQFACSDNTCPHGWTCQSDNRCRPDDFDSGIRDSGIPDAMDDIASCSDGLAMCGGGCVDVQTTVSHCGACGNECSFENASAECTAGVCSIASCNDGFTMCGGGCVDVQTTVSHCGACGNECSLANATAECAAGVCAIADCDDGYADLDDPSDGCEMALPTQLVTGYIHTCAVFANRFVKCWGENSNGQLGDGSVENRLMPVAVSGMDESHTTEIQGLAVGLFHNCALLSSGIIKCWGANSNGQLGDGTTTNATTPVMVSGITDAEAIAAGSDHTCALFSDGRIQCWGQNNHGQLGDGTLANSLTPVNVVGITNAIAISAGGGHTCALFSDGRIQCWGQNNHGQLGDGTRTNRSTPVNVSGISTASPVPNVTQISVGYETTCALLSDGRIQCWGNNFHYALGEATIVSSSTTPVTIERIADAREVLAGWTHTCAILDSGVVQCWGTQQYGALGNGVIANLQTRTPQMVGLGRLATTVAIGYMFGCAILNSGVVQCWGFNEYGALGDGTTGVSASPGNVIGTPHRLMSP